MTTPASLSCADGRQNKTKFRAALSTGTPGNHLPQTAHRFLNATHAFFDIVHAVGK